MKFGIKKSHEMISHVFVSMTLPSVEIAPLSERNYRSSTKPYNLAQRTLDELYNKSHKRFMLSKCPENAPIGHNGQFKLYRDPTLVKVERQVLCKFWSLTFNKSCGSSYVEQTLLNG
jgi:hypothetical protein